MALVLAADIGGTKSDVALFRRTGTKCQLLDHHRFHNADCTGIEAILADFLGKRRTRPRLACLAVAGVVDDAGDSAVMTNLPWRVTVGELKERFAFTGVTLVNDLTALAAAVDFLGPEDLAEIRAARGSGDIRAVIAPGTGLGEGFVIGHGKGAYARGSQGGHSDFAPVDDEQLALLTFLRRRLGRVSYETVIAGPGLGHLYDFQRECQGIPEMPRVSAALAAARDRIPVIIDGATADPPCPLCLRVVDLFLSILGSEAGNLALKLYARGGIYLGGGILPRLHGRVSFAGLLRAFNAKGAMTELMADIPVRLILRPDAALLGAAFLAGMNSSTRSFGRS